MFLQYNRSGSLLNNMSNSFEEIKILYQTLKHEWNKKKPDFKQCNNILLQIKASSEIMNSKLIIINNTLKLYNKFKSKFATCMPLYYLCSCLIRWLVIIYVLMRYFNFNNLEYTSKHFFFIILL